MNMTFATKVDCDINNKVEAQTAKYGIHWCAQNGLTNCLIKLDSVIIMDMIKNWVTNKLKLKTIIEDIMEIMNNMNCSIKHCLREANQVENVLAKFGTIYEESHIFQNQRKIPISSAYHPDKAQIPSMRIKCDKANFFVSLVVYFCTYC